jgi:trimeric autotransporter adhesin
MSVITAPPANALTTGTGSGLFALIKNGVSDYATIPTDMKFSDRCGSTILTTVDFDWSSAMPSGATSCGTQDGSFRTSYSAMITGYLLAPATGTFTFRSRNDDGFIVNINGQTVISSWTGQGAQALPNFNTNNASSASISLVEGNIYPIRIFFSQGTGNGEAHLYWDYGSGNQIIPQSNLGLTASDLGTGCAVGESQFCPADNARQIKEINGTTSNQKWWINVGGVSTSTYALMDSNIDGGGWMMGMKGLTNSQSNSTALGYDATQWTTTATLQSGSDNNAPLSSDNANGKNNVFNYTAATEALVIWRDLLNRSDGYRYTNAGTYGFTWKESLTSSTTFVNNVGNGYNSSYGCPTTAVTLLTLFTNALRCKIRNANSTSPYDARGATVFSYQNDVNFFGFNYRGLNDVKKARFGFGWNENGGMQENSNDVVGGVGIGGSYNPTYGAGDFIGCCATSNGINRQAGFEFYVRNSALSLTGSSASATSSYPVSAQTPWTVSAVGYSAGASLQRYIVKPIGSGVNMSQISINSSTGSVSVTSDIAGGTYNLAISMIDTYGQVASSKFTLTVRDAGLTTLTLSTGTLSPIFAKGTTSYTATVPHTTTSITVTPTGALSSSTYQTNVNSAGLSSAINSGTTSGSLALNYGSNTILIRVSTANAPTTTRDYTLTVTREFGPCSPTSSASDGFTTLTFSTTGGCTWSTPTGLANAQLLVVGGGGGGGDSSTTHTGGGGGAGGYFSSSSVAVSGDVLIIVGVGGSGASSSTTNGTAGGDSAFGSLKVGGGGYGNSVSFATSQRAGAGNGGSGYVSGGSGGGGRSRNAGNNDAKLGGTAGARDASGVAFLGTTYTGLDGAAGGNGWEGDLASGAFGGAISSSSRTSSISGSSVVYSKAGVFLPWDSGSNTERPQTYGSGGSANYNYGSPETAGNTLGGNGAQGVVILRYAMPSAPTSLVATPGAGQVSIAFNAGVNIGAGITNYKYSLDGTNYTAFSPAVTTSPVVVTGLTNGTAYTIYLKAVNAVGDSAASSSVTSTPVAAPAAPTSLVATSGNGQISIAFTAGSTNGSAITNYKYSLDGSSYTAFSPVDATTPVVITGLTNGTSYTIYLKAVNAIGDGAASASVTATPNVIPTVSSAPTISGTTTKGLALSVTNGTWANNPTSYSYTWSRATTSGGSYSTISGATSNTYTLVDDDVGYFLKATVTATNSAGNSIASTSAATAAAVIAICSPISTTIDGAFTVLSFASVGTCFWSVPTGVTTADVLVVGGGGGGAGTYSTGTAGSGGAGGGGGAYLANSVPLTPGLSMQLITGRGGNGGITTSSRPGSEGAQGGDSAFGTLTAGGGGGGGCATTTSNNVVCTNSTMSGRPGTAGGSGGGATPPWNAFNWGAAGSGTAVTIGGITFAAQTGYIGAIYNGGAGSGGGARSAATTSAVGSGLSSEIAGAGAVEYGRGGRGSNQSGTTFNAITSGYGTGGDGAVVAANPGANGATGAQGIIVVKYVSTYTVTFSYNSATGGNATASATFSPGGTAITLPTPTRTGFVFTGWYTALTGGSLVGAAGDNYTPTGTTAAITIQARWNSSNANLSALTLTAGTLSPSFDAGTISYTASVKNSDSSITITATKSDSNATIIQYLGATGTTAFTGSLSAGANVVRTVVTAQDGTVKTYTVTVTRAPVISFINTLTAPAGIAMTAYQGITFSAATGGSGTFTYTYSINNVANAALPTGLTFSGSSRSITGTPTVAGTTGTIKIIATDTNGDVFTMSTGFTITISSGTQLPISIVPRFGTGGSPLNLFISGSSGSGALTYTLDPLVQSSCLLSGSVLTPNFAAGTSGTCYVKATRAADAAFTATSSATTAIFFTVYVPVVQQTFTCPAGTVPSAPTGIGVGSCIQVLAPVSPTVGDSGAAPKITALSATSGLVGATITITGTGFSTVTRVQFGTKSTTTFTATSTTITVDVPTGATRGRVMVVSPTGTAMAAQIFTVTTLDTQAPGFTGGSVNTSSPTLLTLNFDETIDGTGVLASSFAVSVNGTNRSITGISISGTNITLTLSSAVATGQTVDFTYTSPNSSASVKDAAGNKTATITSTRLTNNLS